MCECYVVGEVICEELLEVEFVLYYGVGICIFYGMVNFN